MRFSIYKTKARCYRLEIKGSRRWFMSIVRAREVAASFGYCFGQLRDTPKNRECVFLNNGKGDEAIIRGVDFDSCATIE